MSYLSPSRCSICHRADGATNRKLQNFLVWRRNNCLLCNILSVLFWFLRWSLFHWQWGRLQSKGADKVVAWKDGHNICYYIKHNIILLYFKNFECVWNHCTQYLLLPYSLLVFTYFDGRCWILDFANYVSGDAVIKLWSRILEYHA